MSIIYRELEDYIYHYCQKFMTEKELMAHKVFLYKNPDRSDGMISMMRTKGWFDDSDPEVLAMVADDFHIFKQKVVERIWREHKDMLPLNLCPKCNMVTRTPQARQCRFCFHDWH